MPSSAAAGLRRVLERSRSLGFLGPGPLTTHVDHALALGEAAGAPTGAALDLGSGGGVPGLVLALAWPSTSWALLDAGERRVAFLEAALVDLGLAGRARAVRARAEEAVGVELARESVELVVARAFGAPAVTAECAAPFVSVGGRVVVSEPPATVTSARWPSAVLRERFGLEPELVTVRGLSFAVLQKVAPCPPNLPRRAGMAVRRPAY